MRTLKKKVWREDGSSMIVETGHKTFDRQTNILATGNIIANTLLGGFIRGEMVLTCFGPKVHKPGYLRDFDLDGFKNVHLPQRVRDYVKNVTRGSTESVQLYTLFHHGRDKLIIHGFVVAKKNDELIRAFTTGPTYKSFSVVNGAVPYLAWKLSRAEEYAGERASPGYLCWLEDVDTEVQALSGASVFDLPDVTLRAWYEDDYSRPDTARMALEGASYPL